MADSSGNEFTRALAECRGGIVAAAIFSALVNALTLTVPAYMLQTYSRVLTSRSEETLLVLTALAAFLLLMMALFDLVRSRILVRLSGRLERRASERVVRAALRESAKHGGSGPSRALSDFDTVRQFVASGAMVAFFDAPWTPAFVLIVFAFHPVLGAVAAVGALLLGALAYANERVTRAPLAESNRLSRNLSAEMEGGIRNAESVRAMGMSESLLPKWGAKRASSLAAQAKASDRGGTVSAFAKALRQAIQVAMLGTGAYLALKGEIGPGVIVAASILAGRALAPVEQAIGSWRQFSQARSAHANLRELLQRNPAETSGTELPEPDGRLSVEGVAVVPPGAETPVLRNVTFALSPGEVCAVAGPSGAGKTSLARVVAGVWECAVGRVVFGDTDVAHWSRESVGPYVGYLPQDVELFRGTVAENIARMEEPDEDMVFEAARMAGIHDMVERLPQGYDTEVGPEGSLLSAGQKQRVGLARALYGKPSLMVLDEPNANLDDKGEAALLEAVSSAARTGTTVLMVSHRSSAAQVADKMLLLAGGGMRAFGPVNEVMDFIAKGGGRARG